MTNAGYVHTFWTGDEGEHLLHHTAALLQTYQWDVLRAGQELRKTTTPEIAAQAIEFVLLRHKAVQKLGYGAWATKGLFIRQSLEQSSNPTIASFHAQYFAQCRRVLEICTGLGADTAALCNHAEFVTGVESDAQLVQMAKHNVALQGISNASIIHSTAENFPIERVLPPSIDGIWADPSRRAADGSRIYDPELYSPPLRWFNTLPSNILKAIKISPAVNLSEIYSRIYSRQWVGFGAECREQILWQNSPIPDGTVSLVDQAAHWSPCAQTNQKPDLKKTGYYLVEPHNALIRSGFLATFYLEHELYLLDPAIAYGISDTMPRSSPFYTLYRIIDKTPCRRKTINAKLRVLGWGAGTIVKKRGFPEAPEQIRRWLRFCDTDTAGILFFTRVGDNHIVLFAQKLV